jgi:hypothetical protein
VWVVQEFRISFNRFNQVFMGVLGLGPRRARLDVGPAAFTVHLGWGFRAVVERSSVRGAKRLEGRVYGWGAHGWRGRWLVNGSSKGIVVIAIDPPARARVIGWPVRLRELAVSVELPDELIAVLTTDSPIS